MKIWKSKLFSIAAVAFAASLAAAAPASAAPRGGGGGGGFHGGHGGRVIISGGWWGYPYWGGWYGPGSYGYYGYGYRGNYARAEANWGAVKTDVAPEDARVYLDGKYIGVADDFDGWPDKLYLAPGRYKLEFRLSGYDSKTIDVNARPGQTLEIEDKLVKNPAARYSDPPKLSGDVQRYFGRRDRDGRRPYMRRDERQDDADRDADGDAPQASQGDQDRDRDRDRDADRDRDNWRGNARRPDSSVSARPIRGERSRLRISIEPSDAVVYLDNRFVGSAEEVSSMERGIVVSPGKHTVTVSRPGFRDRTTEVTVDAGKTEKVEITLSR